MVLLVSGPTGLQSAPAPSPAGPICIAVLEPEVLADLPAEDRTALAGMIDTLLTASLTRQKGIRTVDRQALDALLAEKASPAANTAKVAPAEVAEPLRPFWSAGVLICPVVRQVRTGKESLPGKSPELVIEVETVLAQTGQVLGEAHAAAEAHAHTPPSLEGQLAKLWTELPGALHQAGAVRYVEIADIRLTSSLGRLQWMADDISDSLRASLARPGVALLRPRHPLSTKEERLLRVMGLASPRPGDAAAGLACSPDFRLDAELIEEPGKELDYAKTPIKLSLSLQGRAGSPARQTFSGMASQYAALGNRASAWLNRQLASAGPAVSEAQDQERSRQLARRELEAARQLEKLCGGWYGFDWHDAGPEQALRAKVLGHAMRAAHLDPTSEEAARLVVLGIDTPYWLRGDGRTSACYDRVIAEGERYLDRFGKSPHAEQVEGKISSIAFQWLSDARQAGDGDWSSLPFNPDICRHAKVALRQLKGDVALQANAAGNLWVDANLVGQAVLGHCPADRLEEERTYWRGYWKKTIEPLGGDVPTWDFMDIFYYIRKKDCAGLREHLNKLARRYPRSHENVWWGTRPYVGGPRAYDGKPCWKARTMRFLRLCGDPQWETWEPSFPTETYAWNPHAYDPFLAQFNPAMPAAWEETDARPLPTDCIAIESERLANPRDRYEGFRPLLSAGGWMWLCQPRPGERLRRGVPLIPGDSLLLVPMDKLKAGGKELHVRTQTINWPPHLSDGKQGVPEKAVRCWLATVEHGIPSVWIGTARHGLARFDLKDGRWQGRWYAAKEGVPGEEVLVVRPCRHDGKPKLLVLSQSPPPLGAQEWPAFLWVLDAADGKITSLVTGKWWGQWVTQAARSPTSFGALAVWKDGVKAPLCAYDRDTFRNLDAQGIAGLAWEHDGDFMVARDGADARVWGLAPISSTLWDGVIGGSLTEHDGQASPRVVLDCRSLNRDICYVPPGLAGDLEGISPYCYHYRPSTEGRFLGPVAHGQHVWQMLRAPVLDLQCCSDAPAVIWGNPQSLTHGRGNPILLAAYRPAAKAPLDENDAWYGPWRVDPGFQSLDCIDGDLWLTDFFGHLYRCKPSAALEAAKAQGAVRSTARWRPEYRRRLETNWLNAVRMYIATGEYDKARATIAAARREVRPHPNPAAPAGRFDLWEALACAHQGDFAAADRLYLQVAGDSKTEPFARGVALVSLVGVRYAAKNWPGVERALDELVALFPELDAPDHFSCRQTIAWYRQQARQKASPGKRGHPAP